MNKMYRTAVAAVLLAATSIGTAAAGNWQVDKTPFGVLVSNPKTGESFTAVSEKAGRKQAKILNKIEDKAVMSSEDSPCEDPKSGVVC